MSATCAICGHGNLHWTATCCATPCATTIVLVATTRQCVGTSGMRSLLTRITFLPLRSPAQDAMQPSQQQQEEPSSARKRSKPSDDDQPSSPPAGKPLRRSSRPPAHKDPSADSLPGKQHRQGSKGAAAGADVDADIPLEQGWGRKRARDSRRSGASQAALPTAAAAAGPAGSNTWPGAMNPSLAPGSFMPSGAAGPPPGGMLVQPPGYSGPGWAPGSYMPGGPRGGPDGMAAGGGPAAAAWCRMSYTEISGRIGLGQLAALARLGAASHCGGCLCAERAVQHLPLFDHTVISCHAQCSLRHALQCGATHIMNALPPTPAPSACSTSAAMCHCR
jgi:hypothetical protein